MEISIEELILTGRSKQLYSGINVSDIKGLLGEPDGVSTFKYPIILLYDTIELTCTHTGGLYRIGISLHENTPLKHFRIVDESTFAGITNDRILEFLNLHNVQYRVDDRYAGEGEYIVRFQTPGCLENTIVLFTERGSGPSFEIIVSWFGP